jgi:hypothetical protein
LVDKVVDLVPSSIDPTLPLDNEDELVELVPPSVVTPTLSPLESKDQVVDPVPSSVDPTLPLKSEVYTIQVLLITTDKFGQGGISPVSKEPPPSTKVISFDWNRLTAPRLPSYFPLQIIVQVCDINIFHSIIDEGASVSHDWQALGSPQLVFDTQNLFYFNKRANEPLGILPRLPVTLGGKTVYIDVMVVEGPLDLNLLLRRDYVYAMKSIVSTLFRLMSFPHNGNIVTIDQISFIDPHMMANHPTSLNIP